MQHPAVARSQASPSGNRKGSRWVQETAWEGIPAASSPPSDWLLSGASWAASASEGLRGCQAAAARHSSLRAHAYNDIPQSANLWLAVSGPWLWGASAGLRLHAGVSSEKRGRLVLPSLLAEVG